jgi:2-methylisocitrate lyase-like PEP mutase family enzyme
LDFKKNRGYDIVKNKTREFRKMLEGDKAILMPAVLDALTARVAEQEGFKAVSIGGQPITATRLALPDLSFLSLQEMCLEARRISSAIGIPILVDADTGYGNALNVARTVKELENAGASALFIEDQVFPKACGHTLVKQVISREEMKAKIRAACKARENPDLVMVARTDSRTTHGFSEAVERANEFAKAGADAIFVEAPRSVEELRKLPKLVEAPLLVNLIEGGRTPLLSFAELDEMGFRLVVHSQTLLLSHARRAREVLSLLKKTGSTQGTELLEFEKLQELIGLPEMREFEKQVSEGK